jgi:hypothetical protein
LAEIGRRATDAGRRGIAERHDFRLGAGHAGQDIDFRR